MQTVSDIRKQLVEKHQQQDYVIDKSGVKMIELIGATFLADEDSIFGKPNHDWHARELAWYESMSLSVFDIPEPIPAIWKAVASSEGLINSNYGYLIWSAENHNQYAQAYAELKANPFSRRAEMIYTRPSIWEEYDKNGMSDFLCFSGDTLVLSPEGDLPIKEVVERIEKFGKYPVYSVNFETEEREIKWAIKGAKTGKKKILRVHFDNGNHIDSTEDHIFYIKKKESDSSYSYDNEVRAKDLTLGMSCVTSLIYKNGHTGHLRFKKPLRGEFSFKNSKIAHREYYEFATGTKIPHAYDVHHLDENPRNNSICNLQMIHKSEHRRMHMLGQNNAIFKVEDRTEQLRKMVSTISKIVNNRDLSFYEKKNNVTILDVQFNVSNFMNCEEFKRKSMRNFRKFVSKFSNSNVFTVLRHWQKFSGLTWSDICNQNCKITKLEYLDERDVYDITVEDNHNFFVGWKNEFGIGNGVLVHNCTDAVQYFIRNDKLVSHVRMRQNDAIFGYKGDFAWQKHVQNKLANDLGVESGDLIWTAGSFHIYQRHLFLIDEHIQRNTT